MDPIQREIEILGLKREVAEVTGEKNEGWEAPGADPEVIHEFWKHVLDYESAPLTTPLRQLEEKGLTFPAPGVLNDIELTGRLWELIHGLASIGTYLYSTNHLSDRELYTRLVEDSLLEPGPRLAPETGFACHIDLVGSGSDADTQIWLRYYADEGERARWVADFPGDILPQREPPTYDRDRHLPVRTY